MTIVGLDDTDSRERGMCTTYLLTRLAETIEAEGGTVSDRRLVRLNPAVKHKTRGNAALALETDLSVDRAFELAVSEIETTAIDADPRTSPGLVVAPGTVADVPPAVSTFAARALGEIHTLSAAIDLADRVGYRHRGWAAAGCDTVGRGRIGALAAIGAGAAFDEWTYEHISYRAFDRCGTPRCVDIDSVFAAADWGYPIAWDTVDRGEGQAVCVPNAPGPILHGIRGDDPDVCRAVAARIESERVDRATTFVTNQGTDAHLESGSIGSLRSGRGYRVDGVVATPVETRRGGHVFFEIEAPDTASGSREITSSDRELASTDRETTSSDRKTTSTDRDPPFAEGGSTPTNASVTCAAFEPTKRFRDRVRSLRPGDRVTVCGEYTEGTIKLEKLAVRDLRRTKLETPTCPDCGRRMKSAGRDAGYRCRDCGTAAPGKVDRPIDRALDVGWYEVPPCARRHIAKPLIRGGFDASIHPER
ncbi:MAG: TiaS agmantine-binding domain-containing protein [Halobacteriota archaeon]